MSLIKVIAPQELLQLFTPFGAVHECRVLHTGDGLKGAGALVRMASVDAATAAINGINGRTPQGSTLPLLVRYADSPEEKARKQQVPGFLLCFGCSSSVSCC